MVKTKMTSFRFTDKMTKQLEKTAYLKGCTKREALAECIQVGYKEALKNEKKE